MAKKEIMKLMYKNKITGFTLVEIILGLLITSLGIFLICCLIGVFHRNLINSDGTKERIEIEKAISTINAENTQFRVEQDKGKIKLYSNVQKNIYEFYLTPKNVLILRNRNGRGYMPLLFNCQAYHLEYVNPELIIKIKMEDGNEYQRKLYILERNS